ncbi:MAG: DUF4236 domain-containing protein [Bifidobacterium breve]|jgi:hypothetical protein|nr:DUF4236 domain-containing protein [Bifidobacterium breve]
MGFRIRKSISLGKGLRLNLGKSGVTSVTMGNRGAPHVTVGKGGTRFGTPIIPGTGISYETRLDKPSKKARRKNTTMGSQKEPAYTPSTFPTPTQQLPTTSEQPMEILAPTEVLQQPPATPTTPPGSQHRNCLRAV